MTKSPWSVKGIDPEAREAAKIAARRSGMTVGAWLTQTIRQAAADQLSTGPRRDAANGADPAPSRDRAPARATADGSADEPFPAPPAPGKSPPPAPTLEAMFETLQRLSNRMDAAERRTAESIAPIADKVSELSERLERANGGNGVSTAPVERAVQRIAERLDRLENGAPAGAGNGSAAARRGLFGRIRRG